MLAKLVSHIEYRPELSERIFGDLVDFFREHAGFRNEEIGKLISDSESLARRYSHFIINLDIFQDFKRRKIPKKYSGKVIIVDRLAFYVPYHYDPENYGIYFRVSEVLKDFIEIASIFYEIVQVPRFIRALGDESEALASRLLRLRRNIRSFVNSLFVEFIVFFYAHLIAHHVFEDLGYILEQMRKGRYSPLKSKEEEAFCYYIAFNALSRYMLGVLQRSKKAERLINIFFPILQNFSWDSIISINFATTKILYIYYVANNRIEPPIVKKSLYERFSILFNVLWKFHYTYEEDIGPPNVRPIIQRIFLTLI